MKRTRKWAFVAQEAQRLAALKLSASDIAKRLGVNRSTVGRWMEAGKIARATDKPATAASGETKPSQAPADWAASVRKAYDLDATDDQLVTIGEQALELSRDVKIAAHIRMTAAGRFQAIVRQLSLVTRGVEAEADAPAPAVPEVSKKNPMVKRANHADPRLKLMAIVPKAAAR